jgi:hypothetical protein
MRGGTEFVGYIASGLVLLAFTTNEMRPLRIMAILSNLAFIAYGLLDEILPVLALHIVLLPLNVFRLSQLELAKARIQNGAQRKVSESQVVSPKLFVCAFGATLRGIEPVGESHWKTQVGAGHQSFQTAVSIGTPIFQLAPRRIPASAEPGSPTRAKPRLRTELPTLRK